MKYFILLALFFVVIEGFAQEPAPTSYEPTPAYTLKKSESSAKSEKKAAKTSKKKPKKGSLNWTWDQQMKEQEQRKKAVAKKKRKEAKLALKPQYSDPSYFGHKKKPKKRKTGKRKLCKECKIVH